MNINVRYFAAFREATGIGTESVESSASTPAELFSECAGRHKSLQNFPASLVAINDEMADWESALSDGDEVLFFPTSGRRMKDFEITGQSIDLSAFRERLVDRSCGAYVQFDGWVRDHNEGQDVLRLEYEVYESLAVREGVRIIEEAIERFGVSNASAIHRSGLMELSEVAVVVGVSSPHRDAAFNACRYIIDQAKVRLPIWKKEHYANGTAEWVNCQNCAEAGHRH